MVYSNIVKGVTDLTSLIRRRDSTVNSLFSLVVFRKFLFTRKLHTFKFRSFEWFVPVPRVLVYVNQVSIWTFVSILGSTPCINVLSCKLRLNITSILKISLVKTPYLSAPKV